MIKLLSRPATMSACAAAVLAISSPILHASEADDIVAQLRKLVGPDAPISDPIASPMPGAYEVNVGGRVMYATINGKHMMLGDVYDTDRNVSLAEEKKQARAKDIIDAIPEEQMIVYQPEQAQRAITVFTDVDCAFCQKLHKEVPTLLKNNVKVRYLWFPRSGPNTPSFAKAESVWCADDQTAAMDAAKLERKVVDKTCENPVLSQYQAGQAVGVRGTPTIVLEDGTVIGGYVPADRLLSQLGLN